MLINIIGQIYAYSDDRNKGYFCRFVDGRKLAALYVGEGESKFSPVELAQIIGLYREQPMQKPSRPFPGIFAKDNRFWKTVKGKEHASLSIGVELNEFTVKELDAILDYVSSEDLTPVDYTEKEGDDDVFDGKIDDPISGEEDDYDDAGAGDGGDEPTGFGATDGEDSESAEISGSEADPKPKRAGRPRGSASKTK